MSGEGEATGGVVVVAGACFGEDNGDWAIVERIKSAIEMNNATVVEVECAILFWREMKENYEKYEMGLNEKIVKFRGCLYRD